MNPITLKAVAKDGQHLQATYLPEKGMNLISFKKGEIEVIDQSTYSLFEERFAGLGAMIGPHFHRRRAEVVPKIANESLFPHVARVKAKGVSDPFSHGIGRYAPWQTTFTENTVSALLLGKYLWNDVSLAALEGQNFAMQYDAQLTPSGLQIRLSIVSDTDSLVGIHHYYHLPEGRGVVKACIQPHFMDCEGIKPLPHTWQLDDQNMIAFELNQEADFTFYPYPNSTQGAILLDTEAYQLLTRYTSASQENCWQLYHPKDASFVCIEPISAQDPRHPNLSVSALQIFLEII